MSPERDAGPGPNSVRARRQNVLLAGHLGDPDTARPSLDAPEPALRVAALSALARSGDLSVDDLCLCLGDPDPEVRRRGAELAPGYPAERLTVALLGLLDDSASLVAEMAAWALGERTATSEVVSALS